MKAILYIFAFLSFISFEGYAQYGKNNSTSLPHYVIINTKTNQSISEIFPASFNENMNIADGILILRGELKPYSGITTLMINEGIKPIRGLSFLNLQ